MGKLKNLLLSLISAALLCGCSFFSDEVNNKVDYDSLVTAVRFSSSQMTVKVGESEYLKVALTPGDNQGKCHVSWEYDSDMVSVQSDNFGAVITGVAGGTTYIKAKCNGIIATCMLTVDAEGVEVVTDPYIYSNFAVVELQPGNSTTISSSLYGGSVADMEFFEWKIKDDSVADIAYSRNNCVITAKKAGSTQVVCSHPDAKYDYSFVVYVYTDKMTETYITTDCNIVTINKNDTVSKTVTVDLVNPVSAAYKNGFTWNYGDEESKGIISVSANQNEATITPLNNGIAKITVTHENSQYPLDILVRVNTIVKNTYIGLSTSSLVLTDSENPGIVYATIENYDGYADGEKFTWDFPDNASDLMDWTAAGNSLRILGKKNGVVKVRVSHELSEYSRNLLVILQNQAGSAVDSSMYITTTQNFVQTQVGKEPSVISVSLVGGKEGQDNIGDDTTNFSWWIDGARNNKVIEVQEVTGVVKDLSSRSAVTSGDFCQASLKINPIGEGTAKIIVTHPRCLYDTEIQVKVYAESAVVNPLTISTDESLIKLVNGNERTVSAELKNANPGDENNVKWTSSKEDKVSVTPDTGKTTVIRACGTGNGQTYVTAHLDGALSDKKILVLTADTEQALNEMKWIVSDSTYLRVSGGESKEISVECHGFSTSDIISWTVSDSSLCTVESVPGSSNRCTARVTGLNDSSESRKATVTAALSGSDIEPVVFDVTILPKGQSSEVFDESAGYLTTSQNTVVIENVGESASLSVTGVNIPGEKMRLKTTWSMSDVNAVENEPVFELVGNSGSDTGDGATITAKKKGKSCITVKNKDSMNQLAINAKCGELYEWTDDYVIYITTDEDVVNIINGQTYTIGCALVNTTSTGSYSWQVTQGKDNVDITGLTSGTCTVTGKQAGQSIITVSNTLAGEITKEILVNVANTEEELKGFKYLTTEQNVVTVGEKGNCTVSVSVKNADTNILSGFTWRSTNESVASVVGSGSVAVVYGKSIGTAKIIIENRDYCSYPLEIICNVVDPVAVAEDPYISCSNIITCTVGADAATIAAELVGGNDSDKQNFTWSVADTSIASLYASNDSAQVKALKEGVTQVIVSHPKASISRTVLVICEPKVETNCYISLTESIIKLAPNDDPRTITATLVNGDADDVYDFKWWADSYDKIDMNYTGAQCLIQPVSSGVVTIHVSHPKCTNQKDIVLYISNYSDFAFSQNYVELTTGSSTFLPMEVPATGVDCEVSYKSDNNDVCTVFGNSSVCTLTPGILKNVAQGESKTCTVTATLLTKGGVEQAKAQLLVSVTKKVDAAPYIALSPDNLSTIITMNKGEKINLKAQIYGKIADTNFAGLTWEVNKDSENLVRFAGKKQTGPNVQLEAVQSGKSVITVRHKEVKNPLTLYVIVAGENDPVINLSHSELSIYIGEEESLTTNVLNDRGEEITWEFINDDKPNAVVDCFVHNEKGSRCVISPQKVGNATVRVSLPSGSHAECKVHVLEPEKIELFVYDDEGNYDYNPSTKVLTDRRTKQYLTTLRVRPAQLRPIHYETVPKKDKVTTLYRSDSAYYEVEDLGYAASWTDKSSNITYRYPENIGTIIVSGKMSEGTAILKVPTASYKAASVSITNGYGYMLKLNKSLVSANPKVVLGQTEQSLLDVEYEVRPACSKIYITNVDAGSVKGSGFDCIKNGTKSGDAQWVISKHTYVDPASDIAKGTIRIHVNSEVNCNLNIFARNDNVVSQSSGEKYHDFGVSNVNVQVYYAEHTFLPSIVRKVPYHLSSYYGSTYKENLSSARFNSATSTFFIGDGEDISGTMECLEDNCKASDLVGSIDFVTDSSSQIDDNTSSDNKKIYQSSLVRVEPNGGKNNFRLYHSRDYGLIKYNGNASDTSCYIYGLKKNDARGLLEAYNDTIREVSRVGTIVIHYYNFESMKYDKEFKFPVYVEVRNTPCATNSRIEILKEWK